MLLALLYRIERQLRRPRLQTGDRVLLAALRRPCRSRMAIARFGPSAQNANDPPLELIGFVGLAGVHRVYNEPPDHDADPCRTPPVGLGANLGAAADEKEIKEPAEDA